MKEQVLHVVMKVSLAIVKCCMSLFCQNSLSVYELNINEIRYVLFYDYVASEQPLWNKIKADDGHK